MSDLMGRRSCEDQACLDHLAASRSVFASELVRTRKADPPSKDRQVWKVRSQGATPRLPNDHPSVKKALAWMKPMAVLFEKDQVQIEELKDFKDHKLK